MPAVTTALPMSALLQHIQNISDAVERGTAKAMVEATEVAYKSAVMNAKTEFNNTPGRVRTGQLMNAIYRGYDPATKEGFIGVRIAYGAIQEFGGTVKPVYAKHLWVKNFQDIDSQFKRWMPRDFMSAKARDPAHFKLFKNPHTGRLIAAYQANGASPGQTQALFELVDKVTLPERPYIRPAVQEAYRKLPDIIARRVAEEQK